MRNGIPLRRGLSGHVPFAAEKQSASVPQEAYQQRVRLASVAYPLRRGITHYTLQARSCAKGGLRPPLESPGERVTLQVAWNMQ